MVGKFGDHGLEFFRADAPVKVRIEADRVCQRVIPRRQAFSPVDLFERGQVPVAIGIGLVEGRSCSGFELCPCNPEAR